MPITPPSGSSTSPVPVSTSDTSWSATIIIASSRSNSVNASAVAPAKPPITSPLVSRRTLRALALTMVWPIETWPSPPIATVPPLRTVRMVVPCQGPDEAGESEEANGRGMGAWALRWQSFKDRWRLMQMVRSAQGQGRFGRRSFRAIEARGPCGLMRLAVEKPIWRTAMAADCRRPVASKVHLRDDRPLRFLDLADHVRADRRALDRADRRTARRRRDLLAGAAAAGESRRRGARRRGRRA